MKWTKEHVKQYAHPHIDNGRGGQAFTFSVPDGTKHGDRVDGGIFRVIEIGLYEDEFYQYALPIAKELWKEGKL